MYTRSFYKEDGGIFMPEKYDGVALQKPQEEEPCQEGHEREGPPDEKKESDSVFNLLGGNFSKKLFSGDSIFKRFGIGVEEVLIIAVAAFLFFSREGDKECALMLLALLFIA